ncbi:AAA+ superfamily ATPase [Nanobdella aerobiophila]|uniref:AAA+ superfamily ATPase n=1 Tax=Nanobdella aerobiophila TaxID=2586965 RepID=A0A915SFY3_9ARCH|nr:ATP-binding protein [Nanobdella aerobiophila]BBL45719.1 AAA+ superfamily ATPase [Nanobdella aerobiophila]
MIADILLSQKYYMDKVINSSKFIERELKLINTKLVKVITGIRRSGKSLFIYNYLKDKKFAYVNFDDDRILKYSAEEIYKGLLQAYNLFDIILFDEIQNLENWEIFVNRLYNQDYDIYITGSNSKLLSKELSTHLTGRAISFTLFPFSFREFLKAKEFKINTYEDYERIKGLLREYLEYGGFPEIVVNNEDPHIYLKELYDRIINVDIIYRYKIKYSKTFKDISYYLLSNISNNITYNSIKKNFNLGSDHTASKYLYYLEESFLFIFLNNFSFKLKEINKSPKKVYTIDTGFYTSLGYKVLPDNIGKLMENIVAIELFRRKSYYNKNLEIYYFKDYQQHEIDFLIKEGNNIKQLIQVSYINNYDEIDKREIRSLLKGYNLFNKPELLIITWDYEDTKIIDNINIKFIPLYKWLLNNSYIKII